MAIDWKVLNDIVNYYKRNGGTVDDRLSEFMDGRLAAYYDDFCERVGEERCMPLLRSFLQRGIEGKSDLKTMSSVFTFMIDLTEKAFSAIEFKGDKALRKILIEGEKSTMARKYNNEWYLKSIDSVVGSIEKNAAYLDSIKDKVSEEKHEDVITLIGKYEELRDRVLALKDACPESQLTIVDEIKKIQSMVKQERRRLRIKDFYSALHAKTSDNVFLKAEASLAAAEAIVTAPPKGASIPKDDQVIGRMILPEGESELDPLIHIQEYRDQCLALFKSIDEEITERETDVERLERGVDEAEKKGRELSQMRAELKRKFENGLISKMQLEREGTKLKMQLDAAFAVYQRKKVFSDAMSTKFLHLYQAWQGICASLEIIVSNDSEDTKLIEHFDKIVEALRRFSGFVKGIEGEEGENFDFSLYQGLVKEVQDSLKMEIQEVMTITGAEVLPLDPLVATEEGAGMSFIMNDDDDPFAVPSATETVRPAEATPETNTGDPGALIDGDPTENDNPFRTILGTHDDD